MRHTRHGLAGQLRIAVIPTALTWASKLTSRFGEKHPNVRFTILSRTSIEILSMIDNLDVDAGISYLDNEPMGRVSTAPLYEERYMLVCAAGSPFARRTSVAWSELQGQKLCLLTPDMQNRRIINQNLAEAGVEPRRGSNRTPPSSLSPMSRAGDWPDVLPAQMARMFLGRGRRCGPCPSWSGGGGMSWDSSRPGASRTRPSSPRCWRGAADVDAGVR
jgi:DNA-binding transcriptional LysR family regulator